MKLNHVITEPLSTKIIAGALDDNLESVTWKMMLIFHKNFIELSV
jgi:hypothetical protein